MVETRSNLRIVRWITVMALACLAQAVTAEDKHIGFQYREFEGAKYVLFVPHDYNDDKDHLLILYLHGRGETDAAAHAIHQMR